MSLYLLFAVLGIGSGAVIALLALGIVVAYQGSGVVNLAQGAMAMYIAYIYFDLRTTGLYFVPIPGLPQGLRMGPSTGMGAGLAVTVSLLTAAVLGLIAHYCIFRPLRTAPALTKVVASVGFLLLLQAVITYHFGTNPAAVPSLLPTGTAVTVFGAAITSDRLILLAICVVAAALLWALYRFSRFGLATRAAAENEQAAAFLGYSPDFLAGVNWMLASVMAGAGGILIAPIAQLVPTGFTLLIVPAVAAALVGRFTSFGVTAATAIAIGMVQSLLGALPAKLPWFPSSGTPDVFVFLLIVVTMFAMGKRLPSRGEMGGQKLPFAPLSSRGSLGAGGVALVAGLVLTVTVSGGVRVALITGFIASVLCLSLVVLTGYLGQISLFQLCISGVSAYILAAVANHAGIPFPFAPLLAALGAMVVGIILGVPALRIRGMYLAIVTLAAGNALESFFFSNPTYTGGVAGASVPPISLFGYSVPFFRGRQVGTVAFGVFTLVVLAIVGLMVCNLRRSQTGRRMLAVRANERAAAISGVNVAAYKIVGFAIAAFIAGIAGALLAYQQVNVSGPFDEISSVTFFAIAYLGGITTVSGSIVAGVLATGGILNYVLQTYAFGGSANTLQILYIITGLGVIVMAIQNPEGIVGASRRQFDGLRRRVGWIAVSERSRLRPALRGTAELGLARDVSETGVSPDEAEV
jgi:ABC-type branched-subunit amino acid transport system permease subunit